MAGIQICQNRSRNLVQPCNAVTTRLAVVTVCIDQVMFIVVADDVDNGTSDSSIDKPFVVLTGCLYVCVYSATKPEIYRSQFARMRRDVESKPDFFNIGG